MRVTRSHTKTKRQRRARERLLSIPPEIIEIISTNVNPISLAALCAAFPPFVNIIADRLRTTKEAYDIFRMGVNLWRSSSRKVVIDNEFLRKYAKCNDVSIMGCQALREFNKSLYLSASTGAVMTRYFIVSTSNKKHTTLVRTDLSNRLVIHYDGMEGKEHIVCRRMPGHTLYYKGPKGKERCVRCTLPNGMVQHFRGKRNCERVVSIVDAKLSKFHFTGDRNAETLVRCDFSDGRVKHFRGPCGNEVVVCCEHPTGHVQYFDGIRGAERVVRVRFPGGEVAEFEGERGTERIWRMTFKQGHVAELQRDNERVRMMYPDGRVLDRPMSSFLHSQAPQ